MTTTEPVELTPELDAALDAEAPPVRSAGRWATGGAIFAAILSSACCWLPLALIGVGVSAAGVGSFFETYRPYMLGATGLLLAGGFYLVYFRKPRCEPGSACAAPDPKLRRLNRVMLWVATVVVAVFAFFPNYSGFMLAGGGTDGIVTSAEGAEVRQYEIEGMTCGGCARTLELALTDVPGVSAAEVSYETGIARVSYELEVLENPDGMIIEAIERAGYVGTPAEPR